MRYGPSWDPTESAMRGWDHTSARSLSVPSCQVCRWCRARALIFAHSVVSPQLPASVWERERHKHVAP